MSGPAPPTPHCLAPALAQRPQHPISCVPEWTCAPTDIHLTATQPIWPDWHGAAADTAAATAASCPCTHALALPSPSCEPEPQWAAETHRCLWSGLDRLAQDLEAAVASVDDPTPALLADAVIAPLWRWRREHAHLFLETNARAPVSPVSCARVFSCVRRALARFADAVQARLALQAGRSPLGREGFARQLSAFAACFRDAIWRACADESHVAFPADSADNAAAASTPPAVIPPQATYMLLAAAESVADATQVRAAHALSAISSLSQQP